MRRAAAVVLAVACGACLPKKEQPRPCPGAPVVFHVTNEHWSTIDIYLEGAMRVRLGMVTSFRTERFVLPAAVVGAGRGMRLVALPVGAVTGVRTDEFTGSPGQEVSWRVTQPLRQAPATLRVESPDCGGGEIPVDSAAADSLPTVPASARAVRRLGERLRICGIRQRMPEECVPAAGERDAILIARDLG